jgi:hypothetical protein
MFCSRNFRTDLYEPVWSYMAALDRGWIPRGSLMNNPHIVRIVLNVPGLCLLLLLTPLVFCLVDRSQPVPMKMRETSSVLLKKPWVTSQSKRQLPMH